MLIFALTFLVLSIEARKNLQDTMASYTDAVDWLNDTVTQEIDHFNTSSFGTYEQRFWRYNDSAINTTDTFNMLYICGEWNCDPTKTPGAAMDYATARGGKIWVLEHRYYGES